MHKLSNFLSFTVLISALLLLPLKIRACSFNPDYIISNSELTDFQTMDQKEIQEFLEIIGGALKNYSTIDIDGRKKLASEIIYRASQDHKINPQVIIALLQKEKGLISKKAPSDDEYNWATGFACYDNRKPIKRFRGFVTQVYRAAWRLNYFLEHPWEFTYRPGQIYKINGQKVVPQNLATAAFYNYTPHIKGNNLFWQIWQNWFATEEGPIPEGSLVRIKNQAGIWLIQNNKRRPFHSATVFLMNHQFKDVKIVNQNELEGYEVGEVVGFPNYSLVSLGEKIFMLSNTEKRPISYKMFRAIGFNPEEVIKVEENDIASYQIGERIDSPYPTGALLQDEDSKGVYYVKGNVKQPIVDITILDNNFPYNTIIKVSHKELSKFETGPQIKFRDGTLLKTPNSPTVYVISHEKYCPIFSAETFEALGYQWDAIINVREDILNLHSPGEIIKI